ncbi:MAG: hypothetical protein KC656_27855, partial [Myxococcales bacterium]|nr:hypothetical protein [Myxococcales bacterium]
LDLDEDPDPIRPGRGGTTRTATGPVGDDIRKSLEGTGLRYRHVMGVEQSLRNSDLDPREWLYKATPHAGRFIVEARLGLGNGDVDRQADVRVVMDGTAQTPSAYYMEAPRAGKSVRGGVYAGYAPIAFLDIGAFFGLQYGKRFFTTGIEQLQDGTFLQAPEQTVPAAQIVIQPRARVYLIPTGIAKPYVAVGPDFRIFDDYKVVQPDNVLYPIPIGGMVPGALGAGGLLIDPSPIVGFFAEFGYIRHFGGRAKAGEKVYPVDPNTVWDHERPAAPKANASTIAIELGAQFRL